MHSEKEMVSNLISLMGHVEGITEENGLAPPVEVSATDCDGNQWNCEYYPHRDWVHCLPVVLHLPITLRLIDANGRTVEHEIADLLRPEWLKTFVQ
jgi:hypothetical protein